MSNDRWDAPKPWYWLADHIYRAHELHDAHGELLAWIVARPPYCDRGHWQANVELPGVQFDAADGFPRYYMQLDHALREIEAFVEWRLQCRRNHQPEEST